MRLPRNPQMRKIKRKLSMVLDRQQVGRLPILRIEQQKVTQKILAQLTDTYLFAQTIEPIAALDRVRGAIHEIAPHFWEALDVRNDCARQFIKECIEELCGTSIDQKSFDLVQIALNVRRDFDRKSFTPTGCHDTARQAGALAA